MPKNTENTGNLEDFIDMLLLEALFFSWGVCHTIQHDSFNHLASQPPLPFVIGPDTTGSIHIYFMQVLSYYFRALRCCCCGYINTIP